jgi:tetraprenyl-beta-curcumene synthase
VGHWRGRACSIPDATIREDALGALRLKRFNAEGAALFAALPPDRNPHLVRLLVAFQILLDFLDSVSERPTREQLADGRQLHLALREALDPGGPTSDYFRHHPCRDDGGYVRALVESCREACLQLPAYDCVRALALENAARCSVQGLNHEHDARRRDKLLEHWAQSAFPEAPEVSWWELTAAASSTLGIHALLALAADPAASAREAAAVDAAYMPWICAASTMLDSYVDEAEDAAGSAHSYIAHYPSFAVAVARTREMLRRSMREARGLRNGARHALITGGMVAMYLSDKEARSPAKRASTRSFVRAGGAPAWLLLPVLRAWRATYLLGAPEGGPFALTSQN